MEIEQALDLGQERALRIEFARFMMYYKLALDEVNTKINILREEFNYTYDYNPIEHVKSRIKTPNSILKKLRRRGYEISVESIRQNIHDIAGIRIVCSFVSDIYKISDMLQKQGNIVLVACKDYIREPKPNGYRSLHLIVQVPVFVLGKVKYINVEIQIRTIAMDFWASIEHKIYYKYNKAIPQNLLDELEEAATTVSRLDKKMQNIHSKMIEYKHNNGLDDLAQELTLNDEKFYIPEVLLKIFSANQKNREAGYKDTP